VALNLLKIQKKEALDDRIDKTNIKNKMKESKNAK